MIFSYWIFGILMSARDVISGIPPFRDSPYIINGTDTKVETFPFIVQVDFYEEILKDWLPSCAASIISDTWVVSAAHCFEGDGFSPEHRRIRAGATKLGEGGFIHNVEAVHNNPNYGKAAQFDGDISLVKLTTPLQFSATIKAVDINRSKNVPANSPVHYVGWGDLFVGGPESEILQYVTVETVNHAKCAESYKKQYGSDVITQNMICAGNWGLGGQDACQGDSGGPLCYNGVLYGIVSWGHFCAKPKFPGVSTNVAYYVDWINEVTHLNI